MKVKFRIELFHVNETGGEGDCFSVVGGSADIDDVDAAIKYLLKLKEDRQRNINENNRI